MPRCSPRDRLVERWCAHRARISQQARQVFISSMVSSAVLNALLSLGIYEDVKTALAGWGWIWKS
jgi:starch phosphorylase